MEVVRTFNVYRYVLATFVIHTFKRTIIFYFFYFLLNPANLTNPEPNKRMVVDSGSQTDGYILAGVPQSKLQKNTVRMYKELIFKFCNEYGSKI